MKKGAATVTKRGLEAGIAAAALAVAAAAVFAGGASEEVKISGSNRVAIDKGLEYLAARENDDGSWDSAAFGKATAMSALAGLAFMSDGNMPGRGKYGENVSRALDYVLKSAQPTGLLEYALPHHAMYSHAFATLFLAEAWGTANRPEIRDKLKSAVDLIIRTQNREGGWRYEPKVADADISVTVAEIVALRAAANAGIAVPRETVDNAMDYVGRCARPDGGFSYQAASGESGFPRTGGAFLCLMLTGGEKSAEARRTIRYLEANAGRTMRFYYYGHYYAAQGMHLLGGDTWAKWYDAAGAQLLRKQKGDGSWTGEGEDTTQCTAMAVLVLTIPNGYLPLYQR